MAISDYFIDDQTGASFLTDINGQLAAIQTNNSADNVSDNPKDIGSAVYNVEGFLWYDTTNDVLNVRSNSAWIVVQTGPIVTADITDSSVITGKIANDAVTSNKLANSLVLQNVRETVSEVTGNVTVGNSDLFTLYRISGSSRTITIPAAATANIGKSFTVVMVNGGAVIFSGAVISWPEGTQPDAGATGTDIYIFFSDGTNWYGSQAGIEFA